MVRKLVERPNTIDAATYLRFSTELINAGKDIRRATEAAAAARGIKAGILRRAKDAGANKEAMMLLEMFTKIDETEREILLRDVGQYAGWTGVKLWTSPSDETPQGTMFDDPKAAAAAEKFTDARTHSDGYNSFRAGGDVTNNPYPAGSREAQSWVMGWRDAEADKGKMPAINITQPSDAPRRGRPKGTGKPKPGQEAHPASTDDGAEPGSIH